MTMEPKTAEFWAGELEHIAKLILTGYAGQEEIKSLANAIIVIRRDIPPQGTEAEIVARYREARDSVKMAAVEVETFFAPLITAATTEAEARDILERMPDIVGKSFAMDYFRNVSKILPRP